MALHGHGATVILGIGTLGIPHIRGVGTRGAGILIGLGLGVRPGVRPGASDGVLSTVPDGDPPGVRHGAGVLQWLGVRRLLPDHLVLITMQDQAQ